VFGGVCCAHYIEYTDAADEQSVADQRPVTPPRYGFGTHDGGRSFLGKSDKFLNSSFESISLHIIGIGAKRAVSPSHIYRIFIAVAQAAEIFHIDITDACRCEALF